MLPFQKVTCQTAVICINENESGHHQLQESSRGIEDEDSFREVPCGFRRHLLPPLQPHPVLSHCSLASRLLSWQTGSLPGSASKWQPHSSPEGPSGSGLRGAHPTIPPQGGSPWIMTRTEIHVVQRQRRQAGFLSWRLQHLLTVEELRPLLQPNTNTHLHNLFGIHLFQYQLVQTRIPQSTFFSKSKF